MNNKVEFLETPRGKIAYLYQPGTAEKLTVMFLHGFFSSMNKTKGTYLQEICSQQGYGFLSLDYSGHGQSEGKFEEGCLSDWIQDCGDIIHKIAPTSLILIGSSMGGWMMIHLALKFPHLVKGLIGIAVAPDFTVALQKMLTFQQQQELKDKGYFLMTDEYQAAGVPITQKLLTDGDQLALFNQKEIPCNMPVRLLHGIEDKDCPYDLSLQLMKALRTENIHTILIKDGDHSLSTPRNLELLRNVLFSLIQEVSS